MFLIIIGKYYVVDAGYPNRPGYLCPYKGERYHMPEWHRGMEPKTPKERFIRELGGEDLDFVILFIISHVWTIICI